MRIFVKVKPNSKKEEVKRVDSSHFEIKVKAPPQEGKANEAVGKFLAKFLNLSKSQIKLISGEKSKQKVFEIS